MNRSTFLLVFFALIASACGAGSTRSDDDDLPNRMSDGGPPSSEDAGEPSNDDGAAADPDAGRGDAGESDDGGVSTPDSSISIESARAAAPATSMDDPVATNIDVSGALVTATIPAIGVDPAGFFIQAATVGPALFVASDEAVSVGDEVDLKIISMERIAGDLLVATVESLEIVSSGNSIEGLVQDLSSDATIVSEVDNFESELILLTATISGAFTGAGADHVAAPIDTAGVMGSTDLRFRMPTALADDLGLAVGCEVEIGPTPLWRFTPRAQPSAWTTNDVSVVSCPAPQVVSAEATSATEVEVVFNRPLDPASVMAGDFTIDGLSVVEVLEVDGMLVTLRTTAQSEGVAYTLTVADVLDSFGGAIDPEFDTATFTGVGALVVDYSIISRRGRLVVTAASGGLTGASAIDIGAVTQTFVVDSDTQITIAAVADATPVGAQTLTITTPGGAVTTTLTVTDLLVNEINAAGEMDYLEITALGPTSVDLSGYVIVLYNGNPTGTPAAERAYAVLDLDGITTSGNLHVMTRDVQNGVDAVAIYQGSASDFMSGSSGTPVTASRLLDAVVYRANSATDGTALQSTFGFTGMVANETTAATTSLQRCGSLTASSPAAWTARPSSSAAANNCP